MDDGKIRQNDIYEGLQCRYKYTSLTICNIRHARGKYTHFTEIESNSVELMFNEGIDPCSRPSSISLFHVNPPYSIKPMSIA